MTFFSPHFGKRFTVSAAVLVLLVAPIETHAIGLSPPEVDLGYVPVGSTYTVSAQISRSPEEMDGSALITVNPRKSAAEFFVGETSFTIPVGKQTYDYLFSVIPDSVQEEAQELYVTFLLTPSSLSSTAVSVITGVTQVVRFTTDLATVPSLPTALSVSDGDGQATFSFIAPVDNGGMAVISYAVTCTPTSGASVSASGTQSAIIVSGLSNGTVYSCAVKARNVMGEGVSSVAVLAQPYIRTSSGSASQGGTTSGDSRTQSPSPTDSDSPVEPQPQKESAPQTSSPYTDKEGTIETTPGVTDESLPGDSALSPEGDASVVYGPQLPTYPPSLEDATPSALDATPAYSVPPDDMETSVSLSAPRSITSPTHPSEEIFVSNPDVMFFLRETGVSQDGPIRFLLSTEASAQSSELIHETNTPSISFHLSDGIYYLHMQDAADASGEIVTKRVMIDTTSPTVAVNVLTERAIPLLPLRRAVEIVVLDALAGVLNMRTVVDGESVEVKDNRISTRGLGFGTHTLTVMATDLAGNIVDKTFAVDVTPKYPVAYLVSRIKETLVNRFFSFFTR